jgi:HEAT repeat protein
MRIFISGKGLCRKHPRLAVPLRHQAVRFGVADDAPKLIGYRAIIPRRWPDRGSRIAGNDAGLTVNAHCRPVNLAVMTGSGNTPIRELLVSRHHDALLGQYGANQRTLRKLLSLTFDADELIRWRAVEAIGRVGGALAQTEPDRVRDFIRRLLWSMNDESGGLGWHAPEAIGEILVNAPSLIPEYGVLLTASLRIPPFEVGSHVAVYRVACVDPSPFAESVDELARSLSSADPAVRGFAALALGALVAVDRREPLEALQADDEPITMYDFDTGELRGTSVAEMADRALAMLGRPRSSTE